MPECPTSPRLLLHDEVRSAQVELTLGTGSVGAYSARSPVKHTANEDALLVMETEDGTVVLAVADGCGGIPAGDLASRIALDAVQACVLAERQDEDGFSAAVLEGFGQANRAVLNLGVGAGTTLSVVTIRESVVRAFHAGDSPILITGQRGRIKLSPVAHAPTAYAVHAGLMTEQQAIVHEDRHVITNMVGAPDMHVEVSSPVSLAQRDTVVVASDGLSDNLLPDEVVDLVRTGPIGAGLAEIVDRCDQRMLAAYGAGPGKPDDLSVIIYRPFEHPPTR